MRPVQVQKKLCFLSVLSNPNAENGETLKGVLQPRQPFGRCDVIPKQRCKKQVYVQCHEFFAEASCCSLCCKMLNEAAVKIP